MIVFSESLIHHGTVLSHSFHCVTYRQKGAQYYSYISHFESKYNYKYKSLSPHRDVQGTQNFKGRLVAVPVIHHSRVRMPLPRSCRLCPCGAVTMHLYGPVRPMAVRAGEPVGPASPSALAHPSARPIRSGIIVVTLNFATLILAGKQEGIR